MHLPLYHKGLAVGSNMQAQDACEFKTINQSLPAHDLAISRHTIFL